MSSAPRRIVVAGATGFVGGALVRALAEQHTVVGLTRSANATPTPPREKTPAGLIFRSCDLFSALETERALQGADVGIYLIHSMLPSAHLVQGTFADLDLILADNFARAAAKAKLSHVIYLGGLIPDEPELSPHLRSRLEVEETFRSYPTHVTCLRAGLIIGPNGSSFRIVERLVRRLPVMLMPAWNRLPTQPIALEDVVKIIAREAEETPSENRVAEIGGPDVITYSGLLAKTAQALHKKRFFFSVPFFTPGLSTLWVSLITRTPLALVRPLIQSLRHAMVAKDRWLQKRLGEPGIPLDAAIEHALAPAQKVLAPPRRAPPNERDVRSVQRLPLPPGWTARDVARAWAGWLPRLFRAGLKVDVDATESASFRFAGLTKPLLMLQHSPDRSTPDRQLFYIAGGMLARVGTGRRGRLEFREVLNGRFVLAAIHDFTPTLPWLLYKVSQAVVHLLVMRAFGVYLGRVGQAGLPPPHGAPSNANADRPLLAP